MRKAVWIFATILVSACESVDWPEPVYTGSVYRGQSEVEISSRISRSRSDARFEVANNSNGDVYCESIAFRQISDHPDSYLEVGEDILILRNLYIRSGESVTRSLLPPNRSISGLSHIRAVHADPGANSCRLATPRSFCVSAAKSESELRILKEILLQSGSRSCDDLSHALSSELTLDLRNFGRIELRPLIYATGGLRILMSDTPDARMFTSELIARSKSAFGPRVLFEPSHCAGLSELDAAFDRQCRMPIVRKRGRR